MENGERIVEVRHCECSFLQQYILITLHFEGERIKRMVTVFHSRDGQEYSVLSGNTFDSSWSCGFMLEHLSLLHSIPHQSFGREVLGFCRFLALNICVSLCPVCV